MVRTAFAVAACTGNPGVIMSKNGNKEAKKPKKAPVPKAPAGGAAGVPAVAPPVAARNKRK